MTIEEFSKRLHKGEPFQSMYHELTDPKYYALFRRLDAIVADEVHQRWGDEKFYHEYKPDIHRIVTEAIAFTLIVLASMREENFVADDDVIWQHIKDILTTKKCTCTQQNLGVEQLKCPVHGEQQRMRLYGMDFKLWPEGKEDETIVVNEGAIAEEINKGYPPPQAIKNTIKQHAKIKHKKRG